jgi:alkylated DNA repair dioxygenase AlkB
VVLDAVGSNPITRPRNSLFEMPLFSTTKQPSIITGLSYLPQYISKQEELELIKTIDKQSWLTSLKRRVQHYGFRYDYKAKKITTDLKLGNIPAWLFDYCLKLKNDHLFDEIPNQVIVNEYLAGQGIAKHVDCEGCFGNTIASLSLESPYLMDFTHQKTGQKTSLLLEPQSLLLMQNDARYLWQHSIANRKTDNYQGLVIKRGRRISLTFRNVLVKD